MARSLSSDIQNYILQEGIRIVHLVNIQTSTPITVTNHVKDLTYDTVSYSAGGNFVDLQEVQETGDLEYLSMAISLKNVSSVVRDIFKGENFINKTAKVYLAFLDADETLLDAYLYFDGTVAGAALSQQKEALSVNINLADQWKNWEIIKGRKFTGTSQKSVYSNDRGLDLAHMTNKDVRWNR